MLTDLVNKNILVTGAGGGIGNQLCKKLSSGGANVIAIARNEVQLQELCGEHSCIKPICVDLSDWQKTHDVLENVPMLDGLVNNAGVAVIKPFMEHTENDFNQTFDINIKAVFHVTHALVPRMKTGSSIVMVSSVASTQTLIGHSSYGASKSAVDSLTRSLAVELSDRNIRVNSVNPTVVLTKMGRMNWSDPNKSGPLLDRIPLHRFCQVQEVIDSIVFLLGPRSSFINGHHLKVDGGLSAN